MSLATTPRNEFPRIGGTNLDTVAGELVRALPAAGSE